MNTIDIEFYKGNENALLILTGIGGTTKGYDDKYVKIANQILNKFGFSVIVATTPSGSYLHTKENLDFVMKYVLDKCSGKVYAMGNSAGGNILLMHAHEHSQIEKILAVNPVLNINFFKIESGINKFKGKSIIVCGEKDTSSKFCKMLNCTCDINILKDIDHNFSNDIEVFIDLPRTYLFSKEK